MKPYHHDRIYEAYLEWDAANPHFYPLFVEAAAALAFAGRRRIGASLVFEHLRYNSLLQTSGEAFKLNNNYRAIYARRFMEEFPQFGELFATRGDEAEHQMEVAA